MNITMRYGELEVEVWDEQSYTPEVMGDILRRCGDELVRTNAGLTIDIADEA